MILSHIEHHRLSTQLVFCILIDMCKFMFYCNITDTSKMPAEVGLHNIQLAPFFIAVNGRVMDNHIVNKYPYSNIISFSVHINNKKISLNINQIQRSLKVIRYHRIFELFF